MKLIVTGLDELDRALAEAEAALDAVLQRAAGDALPILRPAFQRETPVRTGFLRASEDLSQFTPDSVTFEAAASYASFVNDGTRFMRANPFVERAVESARPGVVSEYEQHVGDFAEGFGE